MVEKRLKEGKKYPLSSHVATSNTAVLLRHVPVLNPHSAFVARVELVLIAGDVSSGINVVKLLDLEVVVH